MQKYQIAIIDDDPFVAAHLERTFATQLPDTEVHGITAPIAPAGYDVYIVDNDFEGATLGDDVVSRVRELAPYALVVAYSAFLDKPFLRELMKKRCSGAFDKSSLKDLEEMMATIRAHLRELNRSDSKPKGLRNTLNAITGLLREWNLRVENSAAQSSRGNRS